MIQKRGNRWRVVVQGPRDDFTRRRRQLSGSAESEREAVRLERSLRLTSLREGSDTSTIIRAEWIYDTLAQAHSVAMHVFPSQLWRSRGSRMMLPSGLLPEAIDGP